METYATTVYVITEEVLRILQVQDNAQAVMTDAEVITFAILTAKFFSGHYKVARYLCKKMRLFTNLLSNSRLNRRIHKISWFCGITWWLQTKVGLLKFVFVLHPRVMSTYYGLWNLIFPMILNDMQMEGTPALIWKIFFKKKEFSYLLNEVLL